MNNDGIGQMGAGRSDMRLAGEDLQHYNQKKDNNVIRPNYASGGPVKEMLSDELNRHSESKSLRLKDLQRNTR